MVGGALEKKLYNNALSEEDVATISQLLQQDSYLVQTLSFPCSRNLLHIAAMNGQTTIVEEVLRLNPRQAWILDSQKLSPLHIAAAEGHVEICKKLSSAAPEACFWRDSHDMNPLHIAAMKGHVEIVEYFLEESPLPAMERLRGGGTVLHLCVKHDQLRTLMVLVERLGELAEETDENGETILHLAVRRNQLETTKYLVENNKIRKTIRNCMGKTPLLILVESPLILNTTSSHLELRRVLLKMPGPSFFRFVLPPMTDMMMVVAVLIATVAFQTTVNPPGGVWQDDRSAHKAGHAIIAYSNPNIFKRLIDFNTIAFISSLVSILFIMTGWPSIYRFSLAITLSCVVLSIFAITASYLASRMVIAPSMEGKFFNITTLIACFWMSSAGLVIILLCNVLEWFSIWKRKPRRLENLTTGPLLERINYWISLRRLENWGILP